MTEKSNGIHHITALSGNPSDNLAFYTDVLGLRLVKKTVNFDDPGTWHLYFGDSSGSPGTILTFFPLGEGIPRGRPGFGSVSTVAFSAPESSFAYWSDRLAAHSVQTDIPVDRFGERILAFRDPDGLHLELVFDAKHSAPDPWSGGTVPAKQALAGFHSATLMIADPLPTINILTGILGFKATASDSDRERFSAGHHGPGAKIDIISSELPGIPRMGPGVVHHIAFRAADDASQAKQAGELTARGLHVTGVRDRNYFRSVYFREPGGVLFEIATDGPGFAVDESPDKLGGMLKLPVEMESYRDQIQAALPELRIAGGRHGSIR